MKFLSIISILIFVIFSCNSHEKKEGTEPIINEAVLDGISKRTDPYYIVAEFTVGVIQITGVLQEGLEGMACYIISEEENWYISSTEENLNYLYGNKITVEGEGVIIWRIKKHQELRNVKLIEVHNRMDI